MNLLHLIGAIALLAQVVALWISHEREDDPTERVAIEHIFIGTLIACAMMGAANACDNAFFAFFAMMFLVSFAVSVLRIWRIEHSA